MNRTAPVKIKMAKPTKERDLAPEYQFDYKKARPNRFAGRAGGKQLVVLVAPDVAKVFSDSDAVNAALRSLLGTGPRKKTVRS